MRQNSLSFSLQKGIISQHTWGYGGIGRHDRFRIYWATVRVRVPLSPRFKPFEQWAFFTFANSILILCISEKKSQIQQCNPCLFFFFQVSKTYDDKAFFWKNNFSINSCFLLFDTTRFNPLRHLSITGNKCFHFCQYM